MWLVSRSKQQQQKTELFIKHHTQCGCRMHNIIYNNNNTIFVVATFLVIRLSLSLFAPFFSIITMATHVDWLSNVILCAMVLHSSDFFFSVVSYYFGNKSPCFFPHCECCVHALSLAHSTVATIRWNESVAWLCALYIYGIYGQWAICVQRCRKLIRYRK